MPDSTDSTPSSEPYPWLGATWKRLCQVPARPRSLTDSFTRVFALATHQARFALVLGNASAKLWDLYKQGVAATWELDNTIADFVSISPSGRFGLFHGGRCQVFDVLKGRLAFSLTCGSANIGTFSRDDARLLVPYSEGVAMWRIPDDDSAKPEAIWRHAGAALNQMWPHAGALASHLAVNETQAWVISFKATDLLMLNAVDGSLIGSRTLGPWPSQYNASRIRVSPDDRWLATPCGFKGIAVCDLGQQQAQPRLVELPDPDGSYFAAVEFANTEPGVAYALNRRGQLWRVELESGTTEKICKACPDTAADLSLTSDDAGLVVLDAIESSVRVTWQKAVSEPEQVDLPEMFATEPPEEPGHNSVIISCAFSSDGAHLFSIDGLDKVAMWRLNAVQDGRPDLAWMRKGIATDFAFSVLPQVTRNGQVSFALSQPHRNLGKVVTYNVDGSLRWQCAFDGGVRRLELNQSETTLLVLVTEQARQISKILVLSADDGSVIERIQGGFYTNACWWRDSGEPKEWQIVAACAEPGKGVQLLDVATGRCLSQSPAPTGAVFDRLAVAPQVGYCVASNSSRVALFLPERGKLAGDFSFEGASDLSLTPCGRYLLFTSHGVELVDLESTGAAPTRRSIFKVDPSERRWSLRYWANMKHGLIALTGPDGEIEVFGPGNPT